MTSSETDVAAETSESSSKLDLSVTINKPSTCMRHVVVTIPRSEIENYHQRVIQELRPKAELPGFRPGKAPRKLIESRFKDHIEEQVKSSLLMDSLQQVTEGGSFSAISEPDIDYGAIEIPPEGDFTYEFKIEVRPEFEVPNWKGLKLRRPVYEISDDVVENQLSRTLARKAFGEPVDGGAKLGDLVELNIKFYEDGRLLSQVEEAKVTLHPSLSLADAVVENFGDLLVGASEGQTRTTKVQISSQAINETYRGKDLDVEFEIIEIRRFHIDDLTSSALNEMGFESTEELREFVRKELQKQLEYHQIQEYRQQVTQVLTKDADWELPEDLVRKQTTRELQRQALELRRSGFSEEEIGAFLNSSRRNATEMTVRALREHFVLEKIAEDLKLEPTPEEYEKEIEIIADQSDMSPRRVRARLEKMGQMDALRNQIIERSVIEMIAREGDIVDYEDDSFLNAQPKQSVLQHVVAPSAEMLPEAKYDEKPEDGQKPSATVKPT